MRTAESGMLKAGRGGDVPAFAHVAIVGFGLIGASVARAARRRWPDIRITAIDRDDVARAAIASRIVDVAGHELSLVGSADLVVLAAPVLQNITLLPQAAPLLKPGALVTDVGGTKRLMIAAAEALPIAFIGGHPMSGAATAGQASARVDLFDGHPWILTPRVRHPRVEQLEDFVRGLGGVPHVMTAELHDRYIGIVSHLAQFSTSALMHVVGKLGGDMALELAGTGLRDSTRLASSPPQVWKEIAASNEDVLRAGLDELIGVLGRLRDGLAAGDVIDETFTSAIRWREALLRARGEE